MSSEAGIGQFFLRKTAPFMRLTRGNTRIRKYIKVNNERFSTGDLGVLVLG